MAQQVGEIYYNATIETKDAIKAQRELDRASKDTAESLGRIASSIKPMAVAIAGLAAAFSAAAVASAKAADNYRLLAARVEVSAGSVQLGADAFDELYNIAQRTQTPLEASADVFNRLNQSIIQMGGNQNDTLQVTELLAKAIKTSGASAEEAKNAMLQFGQALGSGKLQGDELRSLMENAPYLMRKLADGIGVPVGALKKMGEEGKLTSDVILNALGKSADKINADFQKMPQTIGAAMDVATNAAIRFAEKLDSATGLSSFFAGVVKGVAEILDSLSSQFGKTNTEADKFAKNSSIKSWSESTAYALSYVVDVLDVVWQTASVVGRNIAFVFTQTGKEIGGIAAQVSAVAKGEFKEAYQIGLDMKKAASEARAELDKADAATLQTTAGEKFRSQLKELKEAKQEIAQGLTGKQFAAPVVAVDTKFNFAAYFANLQQQGVSAWEKVGLKEQEEQAKAKKLYDEKKISYQELQKALSTIHSQANSERMAIEGENQRKTEEQEKADVESYKKALAEKAKASAEIEKQITEAKAASAVTPEQELAALAEKISAENALTLQGKQEQLANGLIAKQQYDALEIALEEQKAAKIKELRDKQTAEAAASYASMLGSASSAFSGIASAMSSAGKENSKEYKAMFAVSKAFALAQAGLNFSLALSTALASAPWPANMAAMAQVAATAAPLISQIASAAYGGGRRNGGPTEANTMYQVNESGVPEMWTASNGKEYMMTGSQSGSVTSASKLNSGVQITINNNASGVDVTANASDDGKIVTIAVNRAVATVADQIANNSGTVWNAMKAGTTTTGRTR